MLNPAYQALLRIQSKISTTVSLEGVRDLFQEEAEDLTVRVDPEAIWTLDLDAIHQTVESMMAKGFKEILTKGEPKRDKPNLVRIKECDALGLFALQEALIIKMMKEL